jgi:hypothetical protein
MFLYVFDVSTATPISAMEHAHTNDYQSSPVHHDGVTYLLSRHGYFTVLPNPVGGSEAGIPDRPKVEVSFDGYGDAIWPRFRADNCGSGRTDANCAELAGAGPTTSMIGPAAILGVLPD